MWDKNCVMDLSWIRAVQLMLVKNAIFHWICASDINEYLLFILDMFEALKRSENDHNG